MEIVPPQFDTELTNLLEKYLVENDINSALNIINENKFSDTLKENCADLIPLVTGYLSEAVSKENTGVFDCCKTLLCIIAQRSRTQDVIYELMNIIETCDEDFKLVHLLPAYAICWSRIPNNRLETLQWSLNSIYIYMENVLDMNDDTSELHVLRLLQLCDAIGDFSSSILHEVVSENFNLLGPNNKRAILVKFIVKIIGKPLGYFDVKNNEKTRNAAKKLFTILRELIGDIFIFLAYFDCEIAPVDNVFECKLSSLGFTRLFLKHGLHTNERRLSVPIEEKEINPGNESNSTIMKEKILEASLAFICDHGWTHRTIGYGAESLGLPCIAHGLFPDGGVELLYHFYTKCNMQLNNLIQKGPNHATKINIFDFIQFAVKERLLMNELYLARWPEALALMALPNNVPKSMHCLLSLADDMCYHGGDRSVDFDWYSRRIALAGIYQATELYMIQDNSRDYENTWEFLRRRVKDVEYVKNSLDKTTAVLDKTSHNANAALLTVRNLLNLK